MAHQNEDNPLAVLLPLLTNASNTPLADALAVLLNAAMQYERETHIGAAPYERKEERNGQANGYKDRSLSTRLGELSVSVPQGRGNRIRAIFNAANLLAVQSRLREAVKEYSTKAPKLSAWLEKAIAEGLTVFALPESQRRFLRTSNGLERVNKELRRRFRVVPALLARLSRRRPVCGCLPRF